MTGCRAALSAFAEATADRRSLGGGWSGPPLAGSAAQSDALKASRANKSPGQRPGLEPKGGTAPSYISSPARQPGGHLGACFLTVTQRSESTWLACDRPRSDFPRPCHASSAPYD